MKYSNKHNKLKKAFKTAFPHTIPILTGFLFLGAAYGLYMNSSGFSPVYPMLMSLLIFAGSVEFITLLNHIYWFAGATIGGVFGSLINFDTTGIEFVMTALFIVIFLEQWSKEERHFSSLTGVFISIVCLIIFKKDNFIIPSMIGILSILTLSRKNIDSKKIIQEEEKYKCH